MMVETIMMIVAAMMTVVMTMMAWNRFDEK